MSIKFDFSKAEGIVEVTQTCDKCMGSGRLQHAKDWWMLCDRCVGSGKIKQFMTAKAIREMLKDEE